MSNPSSNLLSGSLRHAQENGYPHDFLTDETGNLTFRGQILQNPKVIEIVPCQYCGATLYLIACDNVQGTIVHYWETPSH